MPHFILSAAMTAALASVCISGAYADDARAPVTLYETIDATYANNPEINAARERIRETEELYARANANWFPNISAETSIFSSFLGSKPKTSADGTTTRDMSLNLDQPIWRGGRTQAEIEKSQEQIAAARGTLEQTRRDVFLRTVSIYMNVIRDMELLNLRRKNEIILEQELEAAWERKDMGDLTDTDVQQTGTRLSRAKSDTAQAQADLDISKSLFEEITGLPAPDSLIVPEHDFLFPASIDDMVQIAEGNSPSLEVARANQRATRHDINMTYGELMPQISAFASVSKQYEPQPGTLSQSDAETVGLRARMVLYEGGAGQPPFWSPGVECSFCG